MAYNTSITDSIKGRRFGLQLMPIAQSGATAPHEFLVGPSDIRLEVTTGETTAGGVSPRGISWLTGTSVASTPVYVLDPPIPGVRKIVHFGSTDSKLWLRTKNAEVIRTSGASTGAAATAITSSAGGTLEMWGLTTAIWLYNLASTLSGISLAATT